MHLHSKHTTFTWIAYLFGGESAGVTGKRKETERLAVIMHSYII